MEKRKQQILFTERNREELILYLELKNINDVINVTQLFTKKFYGNKYKISNSTFTVKKDNILVWVSDNEPFVQNYIVLTKEDYRTYIRPVLNAKIRKIISYVISKREDSDKINHVKQLINPKDIYDSKTYVKLFNMTPEDLKICKHVKDYINGLKVNIIIIEPNNIILKVRDSITCNIDYTINLSSEEYELFFYYMD